MGKSHVESLRTAGPDELGDTAWGVMRERTKPQAAFARDFVLRATTFVIRTGLEATNGPS